MARLGDTVAELLSRARKAAGRDFAAQAPRVSDFGANPGELRMRLHAPPGLAPGAPLVVVLHGCGQTAAGYAAGAGWLELAERLSFAVLCPEQTRANNANLCFNWFEEEDTRRGGGEAASIAQMVATAVEELDLDPRRVFVTGLSAGGAMAAVMLATYPELFAAGAIVAGLPYGAASGVSQAMGAMRRVPALSAAAWGDKVRAASPAVARRPHVSIWVGEADTTVTPAAGQALALQWCDVNGCSAPPVEAPTTAAGHRHTIWRTPDGGSGVELHRIAGLGHGVPIATSGPDACGTPAPWILDAGVSSTVETARSWGLGDPRTLRAAEPRAAEAPRAEAPPSATAPPPPAGQVLDTISRALRQAGLLR